MILVQRDGVSNEGDEMTEELLTPREVPHVSTEFRTIKTPIPVPDSIPVLEQLATCEPRSMGGQPAILWDRAKEYSIWDTYGNRWIDFSSGVLVANAGHGADEIVEAVKQQADHGLLHSYCFPNQPRVELVKKICDLSPDPLSKVFLLTTGSETTEAAIKLARTAGLRRGNRDKKIMVSFENAFHGRTLGAQLIGGLPKLKEWAANLGTDFVQVPFPDGWRNTDTRFSAFEGSLKEQRVAAEQVCGVVMETYQGATAAFAPAEYVQELRKWCDQNEAVLIFDEVQAGFGRTGTFWGFEHYGVLPDLMCLGKGISSSLPLAAVVGTEDILDQYEPGSMSTTHSANPVACRAALANIERIQSKGLVDQAKSLGKQMHARLEAIQRKHTRSIGVVLGKGLVAGVLFAKAGTKEAAPDVAKAVVKRCVEKGLMLFNPVGPGGETIKINPPLCVSPEALNEGLDVFEEAVTEIEEEVGI